MCQPADKSISMKSTYFLFALLLYSTCILSAAAQQGDDHPMALLRQFDSQPSTTQAKVFFARLRAEGLSSVPGAEIRTVHPDSLKVLVWYFGAKYCHMRQDFTQSAAYAEKALALSKKGKNHRMEADCETLLAADHIRLGNINHALFHATKVTELEKNGGNPDNISSSLNTLAAVYLFAGQPEQAFTHIMDALEQCDRANNPARRAAVLGTASEICHRLGRDEKALRYASAALDIERARNDKAKQAVRQAQRAAPLIALNRSAEAETALAEAIPILRKEGDHHGLAIACNQMGSLLLKEGKDAEAVRFYQEGLDIFVKQHDLYNESHSRRGLYQALRESDPDAAMAHNDRYNQLRDSLYDRQTGMLLSQYAAQYGNEKLQEENDSLRTRWLWASIIFAFFCIVAPITFILSRRRMQRERNKNAGLEQQLSHLEKRNTALRNEADTATAVIAAPAQPDEKADHKFLAAFVKAVSEGIDEGKTDVESVAKRLGISRPTLRLRLHNTVGQTPKTYINTVLMHRAAHILTHNPALTVVEVAQQCGFSESANFIRSFKRVHHVTPAKYASSQKEKNKQSPRDETPQDEVAASGDEPSEDTE